METNTLDRLTAGPEVLTEQEIKQAEAAWVAGERGHTPSVLAAAQQRARAEAAYEAALEEARTGRSADANHLERDLVQRRDQARHTWQFLYLEGEKARKHAEACWETVKQEALVQKAHRTAL